MKAFLVALKPFLKFIVVGLVVVFLVLAIVALIFWIRKQRAKSPPPDDIDIKRVN